MISLKKHLSIYILKLSAYFKKISQFFSNVSTRIYSIDDSNLTIESLDEIGNDATLFKSNAILKLECIDNNDEHLKHAVYLYFLTKQAASIYEAKIKYLPLQVYNEMRNALDHYFRSLITIDKNTKASHIGKMEGHLQRAFLDITKLTCAETMESIIRTHKRIGEKPLSFVNNGEYIKTFTNLRVNAESKLIEAKQIEYSLGSEREDSVLEKYIDALSAHTLIYNFHKNNLGNLKWGMAKWFVLKPVGFFITLLAGIIGGYVVRVLWAASEDLPIVKQFIDFIKIVATL